MTTNIRNWSTTAGDNNDPSPNGAPEGMQPSGVNDTIRENMASVRQWYENADWIDFGNEGIVFVNSTQFRVTGDFEFFYPINRRVRAIGNSPFEVYGVITAVEFTSPNTTVTVVWDSGSLDNSLSEIAVGAIPTNQPIPAEAVFNGADLGGNNTFNGLVAYGDGGELEINTDAVTITTANHTLDTEADAATDDLSVINGGIDGATVVVRIEDNARPVTIRHGVGNIRTSDGSDIYLTNTDQKVSLQFDEGLGVWLVLSLGGSGVPPGMVCAWPTATLPVGWLVCDGREVSRVDYAGLFAVISSFYGDGDGLTTFNLPDYRGQFLRGRDPDALIDEDAESRTDRGDGITGAEVGTRQMDEIRAHNHAIPRFGGGNNNGSATATNGQPGVTDQTGGSETRPKNVNVNWCIRA